MTNKLKTGYFITFEGTDGVGKSTQIKLLLRWFQKKKIPVTFTREPGGGMLSEKIRAILLNPKSEITPLAELFLYQAARAAHVEHVIRPALKKNHVVLCDRFTDATIAYQGFGRKLDLGIIKQLNRIAAAGCQPDLTIWLDLPSSVGLRKALNRHGRHKNAGDRIEREGAQFQEKVRAGYRYISQSEPRRFFRISVEQTIEATQDKIRSLVQKKLGIT